MRVWQSEGQRQTSRQAGTQALAGRQAGRKQIGPQLVCVCIEHQVVTVGRGAGHVEAVPEEEKAGLGVTGSAEASAGVCRVLGAGVVPDACTAGRMGDNTLWRFCQV